MKTMVKLFGFFLLGIFLFIGCSKKEDKLDNVSRNKILYNNDMCFTGSETNDNYSNEGYNEYIENPFVNAAEEPVSTFSIDADGGSYSNVRRFLNDNQLPPPAAVRTEELINYFQYDYPDSGNEHPITLNGEISNCPWTIGNKLIRIGIKGKEIPKQELPNTNFVFLIDVSGSMGAPNKLRLLKESFSMFAHYLLPGDKIAIVTYAGTAGVVLESTPGYENETIINAINSLSSGGSTAGAQGIITAYEIAEANFIEGGNNRVILATDGDFNVGVSSQEELINLIEEKRETGIYLTVLGFGTGNYQDGKMEQLADNGNGTYEYIDNIEQAKKVFLYEFTKFYAVAKDVKVQVEFNPVKVQAYRLIGYENRVLNEEDFEDDTKDAGEIGAGQCITALYEIIPTHYSPISQNFINIDFRYKLPDEEVSIPIELEIYDFLNNFGESSENMRFAATVAGYGMLLRDSEYKGNLTYEMLIHWAENAKNYDPHGYRTEFSTLLNIAKNL